MTARPLAFAVESGTDVRLVDGLAERYELTVLARNLSPGVEISRPPAARVRVVIGPSGRAAFAAWLARNLPREKSASILVQGYGPAALVANVHGAIRGSRVTMLVCSPLEQYYRTRRDWTGPGKPFRRRELRLLELAALLNARLGQRYVALSRYLADVVRSHGTERPVHVVPVYGVDVNRFRPDPANRGAVRRRLGLPEAGALLFFSSRIAPEKDAETLLQATRELVERGRDVWLVHLSGGHAEFAAAAARHGIGGRVIARDAVHPVTELPAYYQAVDLCVQASRAEGLGFSALEALACHVPVVATAVGGLRETIVPGETGWTYPVADRAALADTIARVLDDPAEARRRAAAGRALVERRFARDRVFADLAAILDAAP